MKPFWDNLFSDMDECGIDREIIAMKTGSDIRDDLRRIEDAIKDHDGKKALALIEDMKRYY